MSMSLFKGRDERHYDKARKRLRGHRQAAVVDWANMSLWAVQEGLDASRGTLDRAALEQCRTGTVGLLAAVDDLLDRAG